MLKMSNNLFIITAPSGAGKTTLIKRAIEHAKKIDDLNLEFTAQEKDTLYRKLPNGEAIKIWEDKDSIPKKRIVNQKKKTLTYSTKEGKRITKKFSELTPEERKMLPPPPQPMKISKKKVEKG